MIAAPAPMTRAPVRTTGAAKAATTPTVTTVIPTATVGPPVVSSAPVSNTGVKKVNIIIATTSNDRSCNRDVEEKIYAICGVKNCRIHEFMTTSIKDNSMSTDAVSCAMIIRFI